MPVSNGVPLGTCPTSSGSSNAYAVTYSPVPTAYVSGQPYCFFTNFSNTGSATVNVNSLGALTLKKLGGTSLASGDLGSSVEVVCIYDGTNCEIISQVASSGGGSGTVTSVSADGTILTGTVTSSGSFSRASAASWSVLNNATGSSAAPGYTATPAAQAWYLGTTQATAAGKTGIHSPSGGALCLETTGNDTICGTSGGVPVLAGVFYPTGNGTNLQFLQTNGSGQASWASVPTTVMQFNGGATQGSAATTYYMGRYCLVSSGGCR